ncbi:ABC transporter ATP-binding protein [Virgisporangium aurantiacum]|uniref:Multidrug ABC transporter ATP-binding protein n=1 Tax=Virgisporangium aurantiacum TaxID=175570 RepID=A0A8J4E797_9ACTN|nr:ABC transporter ATP-binding protein [Virgisporangium aurantiacum]GIJ64301.1 multidrug ABC transporter ATP-binding protein [Virgisporangium aurantiacum]
MTSAIVVDDIRKRYRTTVAVDGLSFEVGTGEFFGILGPNGAGKTTTLEIVEGLRRPDSGTVRVLGVPPWPRNAALRSRIGVQLQTTALFERLTTAEQIRAFAALYRVPVRRADEMLEAFGLTGKARARASALSGGQAQRLAIACALVHDPEVVFLDEPTSGLDPQARRNLWDLLRKINAEGRTVVLTTHFMDEAEVLCDRVSIMDNGRILRCGAPAALVRDLAAAHRITVQAGAISVEAAVRSFPDAVVTGDDESLTIATPDPAAVLAHLATRDALRGLSVRGATLEDVFLTLTGREYRP